METNQILAQVFFQQMGKEESQGHLADQKCLQARPFDLCKRHVEIHRLSENLLKFLVSVRRGVAVMCQVVVLQLEAFDMSQVAVFQTRCAGRGWKHVWP